MHAFNLTAVIAWMIGAMLSFTAMALAVRSLAGVLTVFEILSIRSGLMLAIVAAACAVQGQLAASLSTHRLRLHVGRNTLQFAAQALWSWSVLVLPLATVFALEFTAPAWTSLLAVIFLGERMSRSRALSVTLGFLGVLVIMRPGLDSFQPASLAVLAAAFLFACSIVATKQLVMTETTLSVILWTSIIQLPFALVLSDPFFPARLTWESLPAVLAIGISGFTSNYCLANAFRSGDASVVISIDFVRIPLIALVGWWFYQEAPDFAVFLGAALIVIGVTVNLRAEARFARTTPAA